MQCPKCGGEEDRVIDSRASKEGATIRRRRECMGCQHRFTTYEEIEREHLTVLKRDGRREAFSRDKLQKSIERACQKRPISGDDIEAAVERLLDDLGRNFDREVAGTDIGERVMRELRLMDPVAYIRFASIYRQFEEVSDFVDEATRLANLPRPDKRQMNLLEDLKAEDRTVKP